jgi:hypothetical protein
MRSITFTFNKSEKQTASRLNAYPMSRILSLASELEAIRRKSNKKKSTRRYHVAASYKSHAFNGNTAYNFNEAYNALHAEDAQLVQQQSFNNHHWSRQQDGELVFQNEVPNNVDAFVARVREISNQLQINPNWLMGVMRFESRLNPAAVNSVSGATGLIQFMPSTARGLGTTTEALAAMSNVQQLDFVLRYYNPHRGRMRSYLDCYLVTFYPVAMGRPDTFVLGSERSPDRVAIIARQNAGMDTNHDGQITVAEVRQRIYARLNTEQTNLINLPYSASSTPTPPVPAGPTTPAAPAPSSSGSGGTSSGGTGSTIGGIAGGVIGGVAAGPIGAIVGSEIGQRVGNWIGSQSYGYGYANGYYAKAYDTPAQVVAQEILREATAAGARVFFLHGDKDHDTLEQFARTGAFNFGSHTGRTFDLSMLQSLKAIQTASLHSNLNAENATHSLSIMSLFRPDGHSPHFRGVAVDLHRIAGIPINIFEQDATLRAVLFAIDNLAPGRYRLGLPRPPREDGSDANNPAAFQWVRDRIRTELFTWAGSTATPTPAYRSLIANNNFLGANWNERPRPTQTALADIRPQARQQLELAISQAAARGAIVTQLMADGLDHLHIDTVH